MTQFRPHFLLAGLLAGAVQFGVFGFAFADTTILNVSYDPTRELYKDFNAAFAAHWKAETGETVTIQHVAWRLRQAGARGDRRPRRRRRDAGARGRHRRHRQEDRQDPGRLAQPAAATTPSPYTSTIVFLVRKGNPEGHQGLGRPGQGRRPGHHAEPEDLRRRALELSRRLGLGAQASSAATRPRPRTTSPTSSSTCRCSTPARAARPRPSPQRGIGDVLLAWENEAYLALDEFGADKFDIVVPPLSILAEPPVAVVDGNVDAKGTRKVARGLSRATSIPPKARRSPPSTTTARPSRKSCRAEDVAQLPEARSSSRSTIRSSAAGRRRSRTISPMAASSTRSTSRAQ